jgi:hypothetical protein
MRVALLLLDATSRRGTIPRIASPSLKTPQRAECSTVRDAGVHFTAQRCSW